MHVCVCVCLPGRVCWSAVNDAVMSGSRLSQEKRLTHGLTGWPTFTGTGKWITAEHAHIHTHTHAHAGAQLLCNTLR